ncbi:MAG: DNA polymerase III subunit beta [Pseudomonadota bacterium]
MLLIEADRDTLLKPLQTVTGIVERRHTLPILSNVLIERDKDGTRFVATDLEIQVSTTAQGLKEGAAPFSLTVAARKLQDILRALPEHTKVVLSSEESRLQVKAGSSRFSLQTLPAEDFPRIAESAADEVRVSLPQKELRRILALVHYSMAQQDIRYYLNGLLLVVLPDELKVVATDGHRLALAATALSGASAARDVIIPRKAVLEVLKLLGDTDEPIEISIRPNQVRFRFDDVVLVTKVVDGKFPDYTRVIPVGHTKIINPERTALLQALQRTAILSTDKIRGVRVVLTNGSLRLICTNNEQEEAQEELAVDYQGDALDIGFNVSYLLDVLSNVSSETVRCEFHDPNSSCLVTLPGDEGFKYVVMPMRI